MIELDQAHVNLDKSDLEKYKSDRKKRRQIFKDNYQLIQEYSKSNLFPNVEMGDNIKDSCKYSAITMTLIHMAQAHPEAFFSDQNVDYLKSKIDKGEINNRLLDRATKVAMLTKSICLSMKDKILRAIEKWGLNVQMIRLDDSDFNSC